MRYEGAITPHRRRLRTALALLLAPLLVGGPLAEGARPAAAAFPGQNGLIAFASNRVTPTNPEGDYEICAIGPNGKGRTQLTFNAADDLSPAWSRESKRIAFATTRDGNSEIYTMKADGRKQRNLTNDAGDDFSPAWSPDGKQIVFESDRDGNLEIYTMQANGANPTRRTNSPASDFYPDWQTR